MITSHVESNEVRATQIKVDDTTLTVDLADARTISVPLAWFPRLSHGTAKERNHWRFIGGGAGIQWPDLDEDISVASLLAGRKSAESPDSLQRWLNGRRASKSS